MSAALPGGSRCRIISNSSATAGPTTFSNHFSTIVIGKAGVTTSSSATFCKPDDASGDIETPAPPVSVISAVINTLQYVMV